MATAGPDEAGPEAGGEWTLSCQRTQIVEAAPRTPQRRQETELLMELVKQLMMKLSPELNTEQLIAEQHAALMAELLAELQAKGVNEWNTGRNEGRQHRRTSNKQEKTKGSYTQKSHQGMRKGRHSRIHWT